MKIKTGFILAIVTFLLFILFKGNVKGDTAQLIFVSAFILVEISIILWVARQIKKAR